MALKCARSVGMKNNNKKGVDKSMADKPDCYKCKHRGHVPGDAHSCCNYPGNSTGIFDLFAIGNMENEKKLNIRADAHGIKHGWFAWPVNFDPVWLVGCDGFEGK